MEFFYFLIIVLLFSSIQSVVGVGLLVFGTPSLLLLGYVYTEVLWILLPASCSLSLLQIIEDQRLIDAKKEVYVFTIPALVVSLILIIKLEYLIDIKRVIGAFLVLISILRITKLTDKWFLPMIGRGKQSIYLLIGLVHGLSNLGGAPLSVLMSSIHNDQKTMRVNTAFVYFILALSQLFVLSVYKSESFLLYYLSFIPIVILNHLILGKVMLRHMDNHRFDILVTLFILMFGIICMV